MKRFGDRGGMHGECEELEEMRRSGFNVPIPLIRPGRHVVPSIRVDGTRRDEVFVEVIHKLEHVALHAARHGDVVDEAASIDSTLAFIRTRQEEKGRRIEWFNTGIPEMDHILAQSHSARMRAHGDAESAGINK
jgi:hypothetical protein